MRDFPDVTEKKQQIQNFRMTGSAFDLLCHAVGPLMAPATSCPGDPIPAHKCIT